MSLSPERRLRRNLARWQSVIANASVEIGRGDMAAAHGSLEDAKRGIGRVQREIEKLLQAQMFSDCETAERGL